MRSRSGLVLMEMLICILVFAVSAVLCLQVLIQAERISSDTTLRDQAVLLAQNAAEAVKSSSGDLDKAAQLLNGSVNNGILSVQTSSLHMEIVPEANYLDNLCTAKILVRTATDDALIFSFRTAWQEVEE